MIEGSRSRSRGSWPLVAPEGPLHRVGELVGVAHPGGVVGEDADQLEDRLLVAIGECGEQRVTQVVLHLWSAEAWPQIREQGHELGGHELRVVVPVALEEVEAARMSPIGQAQDMDRGSATFGKPAEDVGGQIAMRVDHAHPDSSSGAAEHEVEQERGLARTGRAEDREMASESVGRQHERTAAGIRNRDSRRRL